PFFETPLYDQLLRSVDRHFPGAFDADVLADEPAPDFYFHTFFGPTCDELLDDGDPLFVCLFHLLATPRDAFDEVLTFVEGHWDWSRPDQLPAALDQRGYTQARILAARLAPGLTDDLLALARLTAGDDHNPFLYPDNSDGYYAFHWGDPSLSSADIVELEAH